MVSFRHEDTRYGVGQPMVTRDEYISVMVSGSSDLPTVCEKFYQFLVLLPAHEVFARHRHASYNSTRSLLDSCHGNQ